QNVLLAALTISLVAGLLQALIGLGCALLGKGALAIGHDSQPVLASVTPLVWIIQVISSRGAARFILHPWRSTSKYGFLVLAVTLMMILVMDWNIQCWAARLGEGWLRTLPGVLESCHDRTSSHFVVSSITALVILGAVTPILINKKPV